MYKQSKEKVKTKMLTKCSMMLALCSMLLASIMPESAKDTVRVIVWIPKDYGKHVLTYSARAAMVQHVCVEFFLSHSFT